MMSETRKIRLCKLFYLHAERAAAEYQGWGARVDEIYQLHAAVYAFDSVWDMLSSKKREEGLRLVGLGREALGIGVMMMMDTRKALVELLEDEEVQPEPPAIREGRVVSVTNRPDLILDGDP